MVEPRTALAQSIEAYRAAPAWFSARFRAVDSVGLVERILGPHRPSTVLDAGCGPGRETAELSSFAETVVSVDMVGDFLRVATANGAPCAVQADLRVLPLAANSIDAVWASAALVHLDDPGIVTTMKEFARVARPGSPIVISFPVGAGWVRTIDGGGLRRVVRRMTHAELDGLTAGLALDRFLTDRTPIDGQEWILGGWRATAPR